MGTALVGLCLFLGRSNIHANSNKKEKIKSYISRFLKKSNIDADSNEEKTIEAYLSKVPPAYLNKWSPFFGVAAWRYSPSKANTNADYQVKFLFQTGDFRGLKALKNYLMAIRTVYFDSRSITALIDRLLHATQEYISLGA